MAAPATALAHGPMDGGLGAAAGGLVILAGILMASPLLVLVVTALACRKRAGRALRALAWVLVVALLIVATGHVLLFESLWRILWILSYLIAAGSAVALVRRGRAARAVAAGSASAS